MSNKAIKLEDTTLIFQSINPNTPAVKVDVIKAVRAITGLGLKDAKALVDEAPSVIKEGVNKAEAEEHAKTLEDAGAKAELK